jgi:hypothetical protein
MSSAISELQGSESPIAARDFEAVRSRFPTLASLTYLNSGSYGLLADTVQAAMLEYLQLRLEKGADWGAWVERSERVRAMTARLLNVDPEEIAVTASASAGINSVASALDFSGERNKVVVSNYEFPTSGQIWHAQQRRGAVLDYVPESDDRTIPLDNFARAIDERTKLVVISHVCYRHGGKIPADDIRAIAELAHRHGALLMLDVYQSVGDRPPRPSGRFRGRRHAEISAWHRRHRLSLCTARARRAANAEHDRLVRPGGRRSHGHVPEPAQRFRGALPGRHSAGAQLLCRRCRARHHLRDGARSDRRPGPRADRPRRRGTPGGGVRRCRPCWKGGSSPLRATAS